MADPRTQSGEAKPNKTSAQRAHSLVSRALAMHEVDLVSTGRPDPTEKEQQSEPGQPVGFDGSSVLLPPEE